jgi:hypothetical protein
VQKATRTETSADGRFRASTSSVDPKTHTIRGTLTVAAREAVPSRTMEWEAKRRFDSVSIRDENVGVADATGFHFYESHRDALVALAAQSGFTFSVCRIDGRQIAVFIDMDVPEEARADLTSRKPDWVDAVVYARLISEPRAEIAVIDACVAGYADTELGAWAFATTCVAFNYGLFQIVPSNYVVRFGTRATVHVSMEFDGDAESWFGESAVSIGAE